MWNRLEACARKQKKTETSPKGLSASFVVLRANHLQRTISWKKLVKWRDFSQVANYGLGGQYSLHWDSFGLQPSMPREQEQIQYNTISDGDRLGTFMAYLEDVRLAGGTAFPMLQKYIAASKNTAIFWLNLDADGLRLPTTLHGGCPVLVGSKWITNKWIRYYDQGLKYPCGLFPRSPLDMYSLFQSQTLSKSIFQNRLEWMQINYWNKYLMLYSFTMASDSDEFCNFDWFQRILNSQRFSRRSS